MKTVFYEIEDFKKRLDQSSPVLYDYTVDNRSNPLPQARISLFLFGISPAREIIEYQEEKLVRYQDLPNGVILSGKIHEELNTFETIATRDFDARPGRYESDPGGGSLPPSVIDILVRRLDRLEEQHQQLERFVTHVYGGGGGYDE